VPGGGLGFERIGVADPAPAVRGGVGVEDLAPGLDVGRAQPEAIALYESSGYVRVEPYGKYVHEPLTRSYAKALV
jgi:hypothetical protein